MSKQNKHRQKVKASVIIPIKNGGKRFKQVMDRVLSQETDFKYEVVLVDSGSKDGTLEFVKSLMKKDKRIRLLQIKPEEFGHGKTRNFACKHANGDFFCFITQDALPANEKWLQSLIDAFKNDPEIAGVFGKHLPYKNVLPVERQQLLDHFLLFIGDKWQKIKIEDKEHYDKYKHWYIFFSNNNSCIRRGVWMKHPFPEVEMAEDQHWAKLILEKGYAKAYAPDAIVYHSHHYSMKQIMKRFFDEYQAHVKIGSVHPANLLDSIKFFLSNYKHSFGVIIKSDYNILSKCKWIIYYYFYDLAKMIGFFAGTNSMRYKFLSRKLFSMQEDIKRQ